MMHWVGVLLFIQMMLTLKHFLSSLPCQILVIPSNSPCWKQPSKKHVTPRASTKIEEWEVTWWVQNEHILEYQNDPYFISHHICEEHHETGINAHPVTIHCFLYFGYDAQSCSFYTKSLTDFHDVITLCFTCINPRSAHDCLKIYTAKIMESKGWFLFYFENLFKEM